MPAKALQPCAVRRRTARQAPVIALTAAKTAALRLRRDQLVEANLALVKPIAERIHAGLPPSFDLGDLVGAGNIGLIHAAQRYEPRRHNDTPFSAYARLVIHGAILDSIRRRHYANATMPAIEDAPEAGEPPGHDEAIDSVRLWKRVNEALSWLSPTLREVIDLYYGAGEPGLAQVAETLGVSPARASQLHMEAIGELRRRLRRP